MSKSSDFPEFEAKRDEIAAQLEAALAELPSAREAVKVAAAEALAAGRHYNAIASRVLHAQRSADATAPALVRIVDEALALRNDADAAHTRAKSALANIEWRVSCLRDDHDQLDRLINPPPMGGPRIEVVKRAPPPGPATVDPIVFLAGHPVGDAA